MRRTEVDWFPGERQRSAELQDLFDAEFVFAERMLHSWMYASKNKWLSQSDLPENCLHLSMMLSIQMCRLYRSVIGECRRGEGYCANIVSRSLYETVIAILFLLKPKVRIGASKVVSNGVPKRHPDGSLKFSAKPGARGKDALLKREQRADLYLSHLLISDHRLAMKCKDMPKLKRLGAHLMKKIDGNEITAWQQKIGPEWSSILRQRPHTYSGLHLAALTELLNPSLYRWYVSIYHVQSQMAHAASALRHAEPGDEPNSITPAFVSGLGEIDGALMSASGVFLVGLHIFQDCVGFGEARGMVIDGLHRQFHKVYDSD